MRRSTKFLPLLVAGLALAACDDSSGPDSGQLNIRLTDAAGDLEEAWIQIDEFQLIGDGEGDAGRIVIQPEEAGYIDLLTLAGGKFIDVVDAPVAAGRYTELRVVLDEAWVRLKDGRVFATAGATLPAGEESAGTLKCPSCSSSGFKVKFADGGFTVDDESIVLIDFDVAQSFGHEAGKSGQWIMHPVLRATTEAVKVGKITGNVTLATGITLPATCGGATPALTMFKPVATMGTDVITGSTDAAGAFTIANALPGSYTLTAVNEVTFTGSEQKLIFTTAATPASVTVTEGGTVSANYVISAVVCQ